MKTVPERIADFRAAMEKSGCDIFIMPSSDPHSSEYAPAHETAWEYFSGFSCENANLLITKSEAALWVDGRFFGAADKALSGTGVESMHMGVKGVPSVLAWLELRLKKGSVLGYNAETMPLSNMRQLKAVCDKCGAELKDMPLVDEVWIEDREPLPHSPAWILDKKYAGLEPPEKLSILRSKLRELNCSAELITKLDCLAWLLNLRASDVDCTPYALAFCYVSMENTILFMDYSRLEDDAKEKLLSWGVQLRGYKEMPEFLAENKKAETVLIDPKSLNASLNNALHNNPVFTVVEGSDPIAMLKAVKNDTELSCTREAHIYDGAAMVKFQIELERRLSQGEKLRETDIDTILHKYRSANPGFISESFPTIAAYGPNAANMHYAPKAGSDAELQNKGFLLIDSGATYYTGTTDITRTYALGELSYEEKLSYTRVLRCHIDVAMAVWKEGATGGELDMLARQVMWKHMLDYRCGTGHSVSHVGAVHEGPHSLRPHNQVAFVPGMVITDEPGIYQEGSIGIRIENELYCAEAGESEYGRFLRFLPLTFVPIDLSAVIAEELTNEEKEWINKYHAEDLSKLSPLLNKEETAWLIKKCASI